MELTEEQYEAIVAGELWDAMGKPEIVGKHRWYNDIKQAYRSAESGELIIVISHDGNNETVDMDYRDYPAHSYPAEAYEFTETRYRKVEPNAV